MKKKQLNTNTKRWWERTREIDRYTKLTTKYIKNFENRQLCATCTNPDYREFKCIVNWTKNDKSASQVK